MNWILLFKVIHIVGWVSWFSGFFYLGRMFVYHRESQDKPEPERKILTEQFNLMMGRVYMIILNPAMMLTWIGGLAMIVIYYVQTDGAWFKFENNGWMHIKFLPLFLLIAYHLWCKRMIKKLANGERPYESFAFRMLNEMPTLFLVTIVSIGIYKNALNYLYLSAFLLVFTGMLYVSAKKYQKHRESLAAKQAEKKS